MINRERSVLIAACVAIALLVSPSADAKKKKTKAAAVTSVPATPGAGGVPEGVIPDHGHGPGGSPIDGPVTIVGGTGGAAGPTEVLRFDDVDTDQSGELSADEIAAFHRERQEILLEWLLKDLAAADADGNGQLSRAELDAGLQQFRKARDAGHLTAADLNGDGKLDLAEVQAGVPKLARHFGQIDVDADGYLTRAEIADFFGRDATENCPN